MSIYVGRKKLQWHQSASMLLVIKTWWTIKSYYQWREFLPPEKNYKMWSSASSRRHTKHENIFRMARNDVKHQLRNLTVTAKNKNEIFKSFYFPLFYSEKESVRNHREGCLLSHDSRFDYVFGWTITKEHHKEKFICV